MKISENNNKVLRNTYLVSPPTLNEFMTRIEATVKASEHPSVSITETTKTASTQALQDSQQQYLPNPETVFTSRQPRIPSNPIQLLILDNDVSLAKEIRTLATVRNIHIRLATTLIDARSLMQYYRPDIVLLNLCFPNTAEDGLSFLAELSQIAPSIPVIVFTSQQGLTDRLNAARLGAKGFLQKPISADTVFDVLTRVLHKISPTIQGG